MARHPVIAGLSPLLVKWCGHSSVRTYTGKFNDVSTLWTHWAACNEQQVVLSLMVCDKDNFQQIIQIFYHCNQNFHPFIDPSQQILVVDLLFLNLFDIFLLENYICSLGEGLWCLTPLSTIFQFIVVVSFIGGGNKSTRKKKTTDLLQITDKLWSPNVVLSTLRYK